MADENPPDQEQSFAAEPETEEGQRGAERKSGRLRREQREALSFWRAVLETEVGRREMWRKLFAAESSHAFETRFLSGPSGVPDPSASWYSRGEQDLGLRLFHTLQGICPEGVLLMQQENDPRFVKPKRKTGE